MALQWMLLLLLTPLLAAQNRGKPSPRNYGEPQGRERCQQPQWDSKLQFRPTQRFYRISEEVTLSCFETDAPPLAVIRCVNRKNWEVLNISGKWQKFSHNLRCPKAKCPKPQWDARLQFLENETEYSQNRELTLTCPEGLEPSFPKVKCTMEIQGVSSGKPDYVDAWWGRSSTGAWTRIEGDVLCMEGCKRPLWDSKLQLAPDQENYEKDQKMMLSCPEGFQPPFTEIQCQTQLQYDDYGKLGYKEFWLGRDSRGAWIPIQSSVECIEVLQVDRETFEISSTSIKLKWTCRFPDACQGMRAMCRLAAPSSPSCEAEEVNAEQMLHGQEGTFTCSPLQPFTEYNVTIDLPPNTTLFSWFFTTQETGQTVGQWHWIVIGLVVLLVDRLVAAVILWVVHSRKRKYMPN